MGRLYDVIVDEKRWKIIEISNDNYHTYTLIDKESEEVYFLRYVIGIEQVTDDEFLVFRRSNYDTFELIRYKLHNSKVRRLFEKNLSQFYFISDDRILFTYWGDVGPYRCGGIYSIRDNKILDEAKWLDGCAIDIYKDDNSDEIKLYIETKIISYKLGDFKLLFTVNPNTLQPNSDCYSQLRDSFIEVNCREDILNIKSEDQKDIRIIEDLMFEKEREQLKKAKEKVLVFK